MPEFKFKIIFDNGYTDIHSIYASNKLDAFAKIKAYINSTYASPDLIKYKLVSMNKENKNMENNDENIINFDFQGWPEYKRTLKDLIIAIGGIYNEETKKWEITDAGYLNTCPILFQDDGMGYGVNEMRIVDIDVDKVAQTCNIWYDKELPYAQVYAVLGTHPGKVLKIDDEEYMINEAFYDYDEGEVKIKCLKWEYAEDENHKMLNPVRNKIEKIFNLNYLLNIVNKKEIEN